MPSPEDIKTVQVVALELAQAHKQADPDIQQILLVDDPDGKEVRLVEVSGSVGNTGAVMPFRFRARPDLGVPYPTVIVMLSPEEKLQVDSNTLRLPESWGHPKDMKNIG